MLRAEWAALQTLIREIHRSEEQHQASERELGAAQLRTAKGLNWVTGIGAVVGVIGLLTVFGSLLVAIRAADDARDALHASQRPWVIVEKIETLLPFVHSDIYCRIGYNMSIKNTGNSIARSLIFGSRAIKYPPTWDWLAARVDDLRADTVKTWASRRPKGLPFGIALAPGQMISPIGRPAFADGNDPTHDQATTGAFLVIGYMQYADQFDLPHHTRFAFSPDSDSVRPWDGKTFVVYNDYQDAD